MERQKLKKGKDGKKYTIQNIIIPIDYSEIPPSQKKICSNRTIMMIERGEVYDNDSIYRNFAHKLHRSYDFNISYNKMISDSAQKFINHLYHYNFTDIQKTYDQLKKLRKTTLIYYQETFSQLQNCIEYIYYKKDINITLFHTLDTYYCHLPKNVQLVFAYTLSLYFYHKDLNIEPLQATLNYLSDHSPICIQELKLLYYLYQNQRLEFKRVFKSSDKTLSFYRYVYQLSYNYQTINIPYELNRLPLNPLLKEDVYARIGFFYVLRQEFNFAFDYFQKCHSNVLIKYLPALYATCKVVQPSFWKIKTYIKSISDSETLFNLLLRFHEEPSKRLKIKIIYQIESYLTLFLYQYQSPYHSYMKEFFCLLFIELSKEKKP